MNIPQYPLTPGRPRYCLHIAEPVHTFNCPCHHKWIWKCSIHGVCYVSLQGDKPLARNCQVCPDYSPKPD